MVKMMNYKLPQALTEYIDLVESGNYIACKEQKQLIEMVKTTFQIEELFYNEEQINKYFEYQKYFPFKLFAWEKFCFVLHNCIYRSDGRPRWSDLFILCGRGTGKNGYLSFEDFCLLTPTHNINNYDIDICANSEEQAKTSFDEIYNILEQPKFQKIFRKNFKWNKTEIINLKTKSKLKYRTNNPKGKDGLRSGKVDFDEPHQYENWANINVFTTGLGKKPHPRRTYVSTNGFIRQGPLDELLDKSIKILNREITDNGFLPFICRLDDINEVHKPELWEKANPSLPYLPDLKEEIFKEYQDFKQDPVIHYEFLVKRMNLIVGNTDSEVTSWENIIATNRELPNLIGCECVAGVDFCKTTDFLSAFLLFKKSNKYYGIHHSWLCANSNDFERIRFPLHEAEKSGHLTIVNDVEVNPDLLTEWLFYKMELYNIKKIAIDSFRYSFLSRELEKLGFTNQNKNLKLVRPSDIMLVQQNISSIFIHHNLIIGDDKIWRWFANNTKIIPAPHGNFIYGKIEPKSRKNDGFMAFVASMTIESDLSGKENPNEYYEPIIFI